VAAELVLVEAAGRFSGKYKVRIDEVSGAVDLSTRHLGDGWRTQPHGHTPPSVRYEEGKVFVRPGASSVKVNGTSAEGSEIPVLPGSTVQFGDFAKVRVDAVVRSTLAVRNAFGNLDKTRVDVVVQPKAPAHAARKADKNSSVMALRSEAQ
jgi:hypothetical protein